ncbi:MAG: tetratricopeptide repeat protein [Armatimonadetes bacterium]|nr:tetratricopeptide repeat protein [Armatimonadota bacterium]
MEEPETEVADPLEARSFQALEAAPRPPDPELVEKALSDVVQRFGEGSWQEAHVLGAISTFFPARGAESRQFRQRALEVLGTFVREDKALVATAPDVGRDLAHRYLALDRPSEAVECFPLSMTYMEKTAGRNSAESAEVMRELGFSYEQAGQLADAEHAYLEAVKLLERWYGKKGSRLLPVLGDLARLAQHKLAYDDALALNERRYENARHAEESLEQIDALLQMMTVFRLSGRQEEAQSAQHRVTRMLADLEPEIRADAAGRLLDYARRLQDELWSESEAEPLLRKILAVREELLGTEHPLTAEVLVELAANAARKGFLRKAGRVFDQAWGICEGHTSEPAVAEILLHFARAARSLGRLEEAVELAEKALQLEIVHTGKETPEVGRAQLRLAELYYSDCRWDKAQRAVEAAVELLSGEQAAQARLVLACTLTARGQLEKAAQLLGAHLEELYGVTRVRAQRHLALALLEMDRFGDAEQLLESQFEFAALHPNHPETAALLETKGALLAAQGRYLEAERVLSGAVRLTEGILARKDDERRASGLELQGIVWLRLGKLEEGLQSCREALELRGTYTRVPHFPAGCALVPALCALIEGHLLRKEERTAQKFARQLVTAAQEVLGNEHAVTAEAMELMGRVTLAQGEHRRGEAYLVGALEQLKQVRGERHTSVARCLVELVQARQAAGHPEEIDTLLEQALEIREERLGADHPLTREAREELQRLRPSILEEALPEPRPEKVHPKAPVAEEKPERELISPARPEKEAEPVSGPVEGAGKAVLVEERTAVSVDVAPPRTQPIAAVSEEEAAEAVAEAPESEVAESPQVQPEPEVVESLEAENVEAEVAESPDVEVVEAEGTESAEAEVEEAEVVEVEGAESPEAEVVEAGVVEAEVAEEVAESAEAEGVEAGVAESAEAEVVQAEVAESPEAEVAEAGIPEPPEAEIVEAVEAEVEEADAEVAESPDAEIVEPAEAEVIEAESEVTEPPQAEFIEAELAESPEADVVEILGAAEPEVLAEAPAEPEEAPIQAPAVETPAEHAEVEEPEEELEEEDLEEELEEALEDPGKERLRELGTPEWETQPLSRPVPMRLTRTHGGYMRSYFGIAPVALRVFREWTEEGKLIRPLREPEMPGMERVPLRIEPAAQVAPPAPPAPPVLPPVDLDRLQDPLLLLGPLPEQVYEEIPLPEHDAGALTKKLQKALERVDEGVAKGDLGGVQDLLDESLPRKADAQLHFGRGMVEVASRLYQYGHLDSAVRTLARALQILESTEESAEDQANLLVLLGWIRVAQEQPGRAETFFRRVLERTQDRPLRRAAWRGVAAACAAQGMAEEALHALENVDPVDLVDQAGRACLLLARGQRDEAIRSAAALAAGVRNPTSLSDVRACQLLAALLVRNGRYQEGTSLARQAAEATGSWELSHQKGTCRVAVLLTLAEGLLLKGEVSSAEDAAREALDAAEAARLRLAAALCKGRVAQVLGSAGKPAESEELYREALESVEEELGWRHPWAAWMLEGLAELRRGEDSEEAAGILEEVDRRWFGTEDVRAARLVHLALVQQANGQPAQAQESVRAARGLRERLFGAGHPFTEALT